MSQPATNVVRSLAEALDDGACRLLSPGLHTARVALILEAEHSCRLLRCAGRPQRCTSSALSRWPLTTQLSGQSIDLSGDSRLAAMQVRDQFRSRCPLHEPVASRASRSRVPRAATALHDVRHEAGLVLHVAHDASGLLLRVEARGHQRLPDTLSAWTERASHTGAQRRRSPISHRADQLVQHPLSEATEARAERRATIEQTLGPLVRCRHDVLRPRWKHRRRVRIATLRDHAAVQERKSGLERAVRPAEVKVRSRRVARRADATDQLTGPYSLASLDQRLRRVAVDHLAGPTLLEDRRSTVATARAHIRDAARERCHDRITVVVPTGTTVDVN